jgi:predicted Zn-dependent protease
VKAKSYSLLLCLALAYVISVPPEPLFASTSSKRSQSDRDINAIGHREIVHPKDLVFVGSSEKEKQIGAKLLDAVERTAQLVNDPVITAYLAGLAENIARNSDAQMPITVSVIDSDEVNACTWPGGYQYITRGLLLRLESEGELASVVARGIALSALHLPTRAAARASLLTMDSLTMTTPATAFACTSPSASTIFNGMRQEDQLDADYFGLQYLYKTGYDSDCFVRFVQRVWPAPTGSATTPFSSFPPVNRRLKDLRAEIADNLPSRKDIESTSAFEEFQAHLRIWQMQHPEPKQPVLRRVKADE